ncbi:hypothetical protein GWK47_018788 [Chionoecetes opilio]|uniref:Tesmin/TSO1-like CXC domain-containing protein n=1 Tax=Chionoecetes opilio TaxID=41210 RepID=A0A8J5CIG3_CHIOP|nr:hypothetical protein GWK47_018788 [Chionoecetes opilio]
MARWLLTIHDCMLDFAYIKGTANGAADALSRNCAFTCTVTTKPSTFDTLSDADLFTAQRTESTWSKIIYYLESGDACNLPQVPSLSHYILPKTNCSTKQPHSQANISPRVSSISLSFLLSSLCSNLFMTLPMLHILSSTRAARSAGVQRYKEHVTTLTTPIPSRDVVLNVAHNKEQLIEMITEELIDRTQGLRLPNILVVTGKADTPVEVWQGPVNIGDTVIKHQVIVPQLLAAHALTGCDTVGCYFGIGKIKAVKVLQAGYKLDSIGQPEAQHETIIPEATQFIAACYGEKVGRNESMSDIRYRHWISSLGRKSAASVHQLKTLPPTIEAFVENVNRAHFQACIWRSALTGEAPDMDPLENGWVSDDDFCVLMPVTLPPQTEISPPAVMKLIQCGCSSETPCSTERCGYVAGQMSCSAFCRCRAEIRTCRNRWTLLKQRIEDANDSDEDESGTLYSPFQTHSTHSLYTPACLFCLCAPVQLKIKNSFLPCKVFRGWSVLDF